MCVPRRELGPGNDEDCADRPRQKGQPAGVYTLCLRSGRAPASRAWLLRVAARRWRIPSHIGPARSGSRPDSLRRERRDHGPALRFPAEPKTAGVHNRCSAAVSTAGGRAACPSLPAGRADDRAAAPVRRSSTTSLLLLRTENQGTGTVARLGTKRTPGIVHEQSAAYCGNTLNPCTDGLARHRAPVPQSGSSPISAPISSKLRLGALVPAPGGTW
jgi:hypothetical protein